LYCCSSSFAVFISSIFFISKAYSSFARATVLKFFPLIALSETGGMANFSKSKIYSVSSTCMASRRLALSIAILMLPALKRSLFFLPGARFFKRLPVLLSQIFNPSLAADTSHLSSGEIITEWAECVAGMMSSGRCANNLTGEIRIIQKVKAEIILYKHGFITLYRCFF